MRRRFHLTRNEVWRAGVLAAMAVVAACPVTGFGAERMVLCEEFTATT